MPVANQPINPNPTQQIMHMSNVLNVPTQLSGKIAEFISAVNPEDAPFINPTDNISQSNAMEAKEFIQQQLKKPLGPDHINTLEQLKIELENITHVHMMTKFMAENEGSSSQLSPEMNVNQQTMEGMHTTSQFSNCKRDSVKTETFFLCRTSKCDELYSRQRRESTRSVSI